MDELEKFLDGRSVGVKDFHFVWVEYVLQPLWKQMSHDEVAVYMGLLAKVQNG